LDVPGSELSLPSFRAGQSRGEREGAIVPDHSPDPAQTMRTDLNNAIVQITREYTGRGPTRARTILDREAVIVLLRDVLTQGEDSLVEHGKSDQVLELRRAYQETMRADYVTAIERIVGLEVVAFLSTNSTEPDVAVEIFLLGGQITAPTATPERT
jgi:uncharacterized protein YbcI